MAVEDGLSTFLTTWSGVMTAYSFNNTDANSGTDTDGANSSSYGTATGYANYGLSDRCAPPNNSDYDIYTTTDLCMLLYVPPTLATGVYGLFHNGGGTNAQAGFIRSQSNGATITLAISHNASGSNQDYTTYDLTATGWLIVGFQFEDNSGNMALWVDGANVSEISRTYDLLYGSGNPYIGGENADDIPGWGSGADIGGSGLLIANFVADNPNNDNTQPAGNGDTFYTDYYNAHSPSGATHERTASLSGTSTLAATAENLSVHERTASLSETSTLTATGEAVSGSQIHERTGTIVGTSSLTATLLSAIPTLKVWDGSSWKKATIKHGTSLPVVHWNKVK